MFNGIAFILDKMDYWIRSLLKKLPMIVNKLIWLPAIIATITCLYYGLFNVKNLFLTIGYIVLALISFLVSAIACDIYRKDEKNKIRLKK